MKYPSLAKQVTFVTSPYDADTEVDVLTKSHLRETSQLVGHFAKDTHIKTARIELIHLLLAPTNASCSKKGSHRVIDGFLYVRKGIVSFIWSSKSICMSFFQRFFNCKEISRRNDTVGIEEDDECAISLFDTIIASLSRTRIFNKVILDLEFSLVFVYNLLTGQ